MKSPRTRVVVVLALLALVPAIDGQTRAGRQRATVGRVPLDPDAPDAVDDAYATLAGDNLSVDAPGVLANDTDPEGDPLQAVLVSSAGASGTLFLFDDGSFEYETAPGFVGTDTFYYAATDGVHTSVPARIRITVTGMLGDTTGFVDEGAFLTAIANQGWTLTQESFEDPVWPRSPTTATSVSNLGVTWTGNNPVSHVTTGTGPALFGNYGFFQLPHGDYATGVDCQIPGNCTDGWVATANSGVFVAAGLFVHCNAGTAGIEIILDDDTANPVEFGGFGLPAGSTGFYGVISANGFHTFEVHETEGTSEDASFLFADLFSFAVVPQAAAPGSTDLGSPGAWRELRRSRQPEGTVFVDALASGAADGTSWTDAFPDLQAALATTDAGEIWVARGTYRPGPSGDRTATFRLKSGVRLYGGFAGFETSLAERDVTANPTILSGDIDEDDTYGSGPNWWQVGWNGNAGNSHHVVTGSGTDASAVLDGFTILAGLAADPALRAGGGLLVDGGSPTVRNCTFRYNALGFGSSAWLSDCDSLFENCIVRDAYACNCGSGGWTSGFLCTGGSDVAFVNCEFTNHYYVSSQDQGRGAALNIDFDSAATLLGCRFEGNQTGNFYAIGGGTAYGAAVFAAGDVVIDRCEFVDNFAHAGAGVTAWGDATVTNSLFARNRAVKHPNTSGLDDGGYGAGFLSVGFAPASVSVVNSTFVDNNTDKGGGLALYGASTATVANCIVYANFADAPAPGEDPIWILKQQIVGDYDVSYSCIEGLLATEPGEDPPVPENFPGCLDAPPGFRDALGPDGVARTGDEDLRLGAASPCIDAGTNAAVPAGVLVDLAGNVRFVDDPTAEDSGSGSAPLVDMGAYERVPGG